MKEVFEEGEGWSTVLIDLLNQFSVNDPDGGSLHGAVGGESLFRIFV